MEAALTGTYTVAKADSRHNLIFGWANVAVTKAGLSVIDSHDESIAPEELEFASYDFVMKERASGEDHNGQAPDAICVCSIVMTDEILKSMMADVAQDGTVTLPDDETFEAVRKTIHNGWYVGFYVPDDEAFERVMDGDRPMFSIEGRAMRDEAA